MSQAAPKKRAETIFRDANGEVLYDGDVVQHGITKTVIYAQKLPNLKGLLLAKKIGNIYDTPDILDRVFL